MVEKSVKSFDKENLMQEIEKYPIISFDIFDTLLKRNVKNPEDVFKIMEYKIGYEGFANKRIEAEKRARCTVNKEEVTLEDIYSYFDKDNKKNLMQLEIDTEKSLLTVNPVLKDIYKICKDKNKIIYIISDMYIPKNYIEEILKKCGIDNYKNLYISCEEEKTKRTGSLFAEFLRREKINPKQVLHIGDSYKSDYINPRQYGMSSYLIFNSCPNKLRKYLHIRKKQNLEIEYLDFFINNHSYTDDYYYKFGFSAFGPFLYGYVRWLHNNFIDNKIDKVFFLARDGMIMQKAYQLCFGKQCIENSYLEVSRRSLRVPVLWMDTRFETLLGMLSPSEMISIKSIFDGVGLEIENYNDLIEKYNFSENTVFFRNSILNNKELLSLYDELIPDILSNSKHEYNLLIQYLDENSVKGKFAIVDIGWSGGMQRYLDQTLEKLEISHEIFGYYTGIANYYKRNKDVVKNLQLNGYLFDFSHNKYDRDLRSGFVGLFELLFLEQNGSVKKYKKNGETTEAIRYEYEYIVNGKATVELEKIKIIQKAALDFVQIAADDENLAMFDFSSQDLFQNLYRYGGHPNKEDINKFGYFRFFDEGITTKLADPKSQIYYMFHLKKFKKEFLSSRWKIGFLKAVFKINLPYDKVYEFMKKKRK